MAAYPQSLINAAVAAWHGPDTRREIVARLGISLSMLQRIWVEARAQGRLPDDGVRPQFRSPYAYAFRQAAIHRDVDRDVTRIIPGRDPLLIALRRHHGNDPRRAFDNLTLHPRTDRVIRSGA